MSNSKKKKIGAGYAIIIVNLICTVYYNIIIAYPVVFIAKSFAETLPWMHCNNVWNTPYCLEVCLYYATLKCYYATFEQSNLLHFLGDTRKEFNR